MVVALPIDEWEGPWTGPRGANAADDNAVVIAWKHFLDLAIESGECVLENGCTGQQGRPSSADIPGGSFEAIQPRKPVRKCALFIPQDVRAEIGMSLKREPRGGAFVDAHEESWWVRG